MVKCLAGPGLSDAQAAYLTLAHHCVEAARGTPVSAVFRSGIKDVLTEINTSFGTTPKADAKPGILQTVEFLEQLREDVPDLDNTIENALFWLRQIL